MADTNSSLPADGVKHDEEAVKIVSPSTLPEQSSTKSPVPNPETSAPTSSGAPGPSNSPSTSITGFNLHTQNIRVFEAAHPQGLNVESSKALTPASEISDSFFEPSINDVQSYHSSVVARSKRLNEAPLLTSKHRDEERLQAEKKKSEKWPTTTIRIKFSNGTQIESQFPSTSPIQPVYAFVRSALDPSAASKQFILYQPPRSTYPEHPIPQTKKPNPNKTTIIPPANYGIVKGSASSQLQGGTGGKESLNTLGLVPQSVLHVRWEEEAMNASSYPAPLLPELLARMAPLPPPVVKVEETPKTKQAPTGSSGKNTSGEKKMPAWLKKGLGKR